MSNQATVKPRVPIYDYARVFVAYLVILGHCLPGDDMRLRPYIYAFHMPFFFLVSGMLHKELGYIPWKKLFRTLIYPYIFFNLLCFLIIPLMIKTGIIVKYSNYPNDTHSGMINLYINFFKQFFRNAIHGNTPLNIPIWFLLALFWCKLCLSLISKYKLLIPVFVAFLFVTVHYRIFQLTIGNSMMAFPFFFVGYIFKLKPIEWVPNKWSVVVGILMIAVSVLITTKNGSTSMWRIKFGAISYPVNILVYYLNAFIASYGMLHICRLFKSNKIITLSANALISILGFQVLFYYSFQINRYGESISLNIFVSLIIFVICVLLHYLTLKYIPIVLGKEKRKNDY